MKQMKKAKIWLESKGLKHVGLLVAALIFWVFFPSIFNAIGLVLTGVFIGLNWEPIMDLTTLDEKIEEKYQDVEEKIKELKEQLEKLKIKTGSY